MNFFHTIFLIKLLSNGFDSYQNIKNAIRSFKNFSDPELSRIKNNLLSQRLIFEIRGCKGNETYLLINPFIRDELENLIFSSIKGLLYEIISLLAFDSVSFDNGINSSWKILSEKLNNLHVFSVVDLFNQFLGDLNTVNLEEIQCGKGSLVFLFSTCDIVNNAETEEIKKFFELIFIKYFDKRVDVSVERFWKGGIQHLSLEVTPCQKNGRKWKKRLANLLESIYRLINL